MVAPLNKTKEKIRLDTRTVLGSRVRRDPPVKPKKDLALTPQDDRYIWIAVIDMGVFTIAVVVAIIGLANNLF